MDLPWTLNTEEDANFRSSITSQCNNNQVHAKTVGVSSGSCLDTELKFIPRKNEKHALLKNNALVIVFVGTMPLETQATAWNVIFF